MSKQYMIKKKNNVAYPTTFGSQKEADDCLKGLLTSRSTRKEWVDARVEEVVLEEPAKPVVPVVPAKKPEIIIPKE